MRAWMGRHAVLAVFPILAVVAYPIRTAMTLSHRRLAAAGLLVLGLRRR